MTVDPDRSTAQQLAQAHEFDLKLRHRTPQQRIFTLERLDATTTIAFRLS
jgi:hypothetical protein